MLPLPFVMGEFASGDLNVDWRSLATWSPISAAFLGLAYLAYYTGLQRGPVSVVTSAASAWLAVAVVVAVVLFNEGVSGAQALTMAVILLGIVMLSLRPGDSISGGGTGLWWGLLAMFGLGVAIGIFGRLTEAAGPMVATLAVRTLSIIPSYLFMRVRGTGVSFPQTLSVWIVLISAAILDAGGYVAYNLGVNVSPVAVVAPIVAAHPVATIALAIVFMRERPQVLQWMGAIVTVTAVIALSAQ